MKSAYGFFISFVISILFAINAQAEGYNVSGKILKPDGTPYSSSAVSFVLEVTNPAGTCVLYREQINNVDMSNTKGGFHVVLGSGTKIFPSGGGQVESVFSNDAALPCSDATTYTPVATDERSLKISFYDGSSWQAFSQQPLKSVPLSTISKFSQSTRMVESYSSTNLLRAKVNIPELTAAEVATLQNLIAGTSGTYLKTETDPTVKDFAKATLPTCVAGEVLRSTGTSLVCIPDQTGAGLPAGSTGNFLKHNGTSWGAASLAITDIANLSTQLSDKVTKASLPSCSSNQTPSYVSISDTWQCLTINAVTSITAGTGLSGGTITGSGTIALNTTGVVAATYGGTNTIPTFAVDSQGRITSASDFSVSFPVTAVASKTGAITLDYGDINNAISKYLTYKPNNTACLDGQILKWVSVSSRWECASDSTGTGSAGGDLGGTYPSPTVTRIQGKLVDASAGYQDGDTLVYDATNSKWVLRHTCDSAGGWNSVAIRGVTFCIKNLGPSAVSYAQQQAQCASAKGDMCSVDQLINACKESKMTSGSLSWSNQIYSDGAASMAATLINCTTAGSTWGFQSTNYTNTTMNLSGPVSIIPYCCRPTGN